MLFAGGNEMIADRIENLAKYIPYMSALGDAVKFLENNDVTKLDAGRHDISDRVYVNVQIYEPSENEVFEAHRKYIDLQYIAEGGEEIDYLPIADGVGEGEYLDEYDCLTYRDTAGTIGKLFLDAGSFAIFEPADPHRPGIKWKGGQVRKLIFKIKVQE